MKGLYMDFRFKCALQTLLSVLPGSENLNYLAQRYLTKGYPRSRERYEEIYNHSQMYHAMFCRHGISEGATVYEIGCGWDLALALMLHVIGYSKVIALDTVFHARIGLINRILGYMKDDGLIDKDTENFSKQSAVYTEADGIKERLQTQFGIEYLAPCDSANTGMKDSSVDCICSHLVFEHIAPELIPAVLDECRRVLRNNGIMSLVIDYADHYRTFDSSITPYNFLKYSDKNWKKYNPSLHYVNRLRHKDFIDMFRQTGFEIVEETVFKPDNADEIVSSFPFADEFTSKYSIEELSITDARIVLKKSLAIKP